jgi:NMD protein affecting ribosome stability and mRNA decay
MTGPKKPVDYIRQGREQRLIRELVHDPYMSKRKYPEPTVCPKCGAVIQRGRWAWAERPHGAHEDMCPACRRIEDKVPAAFLELSGDFLAQHRDEIMNLIRNLEAREKAEHPLKRLMAITESEDGLSITFTDAHLARGAGEAIHQAYEGELDYEYTKEDTMLRVSWTR